MLILSRKKEESFIINDNIIIKVVDIGEERVKIGITAPKSVKIIRSELQQTIEVNKEAATTPQKPAFLAKFLQNWGAGGTEGTEGAEVAGGAEGAEDNGDTDKG